MCKYILREILSYNKYMVAIWQTGSPISFCSFCGSLIHQLLLKQYQETPGLVSPN